MPEIQMKGKGRGRFAKVSEADWTYLMQFDWYLNCHLSECHAIRQGTFDAQGGEVTIRMEVDVLTNAGFETKGYRIAHLNGDTLDNRRVNLRRIRGEEDDYSGYY